MINLNFNTIDVNRGVMHHIVAKEPGQEHGSVKLEKTIFEIDNTIRDTIRKRLVTAAGKESKAFELKIGNYSIGTFFDSVKDLKNVNDKEFYKISKHIAELLAESQTRNQIPGGVFILLDCTNKKTNEGLYVVIKAELHEAVRHTTTKTGISKLQILKDVFLSPSQRLYKIGMLHEKVDNSKEAPNNAFTCYLFDEQFRTEGSKPAEYFYKDFLGFSVDENSKIQTARFYDQTKNFILNNVPKWDDKLSLIEALNAEIITSSTTTISASEFSKKYFDNELNDGVMMDLYNQEVATYLPSTIIKDSMLIKSQLENKKIFFPNSITVKGRATDFESNVKILTSDMDVTNLEFTDNDYTIIAIKGKPFSGA